MTHKNRPDPAVNQMVIDLVAKRLNASADALKKGDADVEVRQMASHLLKDVFGNKVKTVASLLSISVATVFKDTNAFAARLKKDESLAKTVKEIQDEVLTLTVSGMHAAAPEEQKLPDEPTTYKRRLSPLPELGVKIDRDLEETIRLAKVSVVEACLGPQILSSKDPALDVTAAKDIAVFLLHKDFPHVLPDIVAESFGLDITGYYTAIGRVCVKEKSLKRVLEDVRSRYPRALARAAGKN